jgi:hypothetical protein
MWIEKRGLQHRVYWRTGLGSPKRPSSRLLVDIDSVGPGS